jgi:DNA helicase-2/ATP-dependent DNA helicase PcrA
MKLNNQQKSIIDKSSGKVAVVAGAGSGKSSTTVELIAKLHSVDGISLDRMFISTFTNKAGRDLKEKLQKKLKLDKDKIENLWIGTFHSLGYRYLVKNKRKKLEIILPVEASNYLRNIYRTVLEDFGVSEEQLAFADAISNIEKYRNTECLWEDASEYPKICSKIFELYQNEKKSQGLVDYTDILNIFAEEVKEDNFFRKKFDWVFVDECQDNSKKQNEIADLLASKNRVLIGDVKQSIYGFRGAAPHLFKQKINSAEKIFSLAYNYRSSKEIIDFANALLPQIEEFKNQELIPTLGNFGKPVFIMCDDVALQILNNIKLDIREGIPLHEIAVLGRSIRPVNIANLQLLLRANNIPYSLRGGDDKMNAPYIQNYLSVLKSILKPTQVSLTNVLSILPNIGPKTAMKLSSEAISYGDEHRFLETQTGKFSNTQSYKKYLSLFDYTSDNKTLLLKSLEFIHDVYLVPKYAKKDPMLPSQKRQLIFDTLYNYLMGFKDIMEGIDKLYVNEEDIESDKNKIIISTIHQSKGLEFDSVHIANFNENSMPYLLEKEEKNKERIEEEFCLTYVATTRARKKLKMYMAYKNGTHAQAKTNKLSRFIKELYKKTQEKYFTLRMLDGNCSELILKEKLYNKVNETF